jgi:hypothetical protein
MSEIQEWEITFRNGDQTWRQYLYGTRDEAMNHADLLCYQASTRFTIAPAPPISERTVVS